jgi:small-conductance mechanosensitive channel
VDAVNGTGSSTTAIVDRLQHLEPVEVVRELGNPWSLAFLILLFFVLVRLSRRLGRRLAERGLLPWLNRASRVVLRIGIAVFGLWLLVVLVPAWMGPALPWLLLGLLVIVVWSARDVLPDLMAGLVLRLERRMRLGRRVQLAQVAGVVQAVGFRVTTVLDVGGRLVDVPNRALLNQTVASDPGPWPVHEATVSLRRDVDVERARRALKDAALASAWTPLEPDPVVRRDGVTPTKWIVRVRLRDLRDSARFDGELAERVDELLR